MDREIIYPAPALAQLLGAVFDASSDVKDSEQHARDRLDFIFHMTDWLTDLRELNDLYAHPEAADPKAASTFLYGFLVHVIPHLQAAARLTVGEFSDPFAKTRTTP